MDWNVINQFDQTLTLSVNGSDSLFLDNLMICVTNTFAWSLVIGMLIYLFFHNNDVLEALIILIAIGLMIFIADRLCSGFVKPLAARWRPTQDPYIMFLIDVVDGYRGGRFGFFSGHACNTFCMATFLSLLFCHKATSYTLFFWASTTTYTRLYLGVHYFGDVVVGMFVGLFIGVVAYYIYNKVKKRMRTSRLVSSQFTHTGYKKNDMTRFLTVVYANYVLVLIFSLYLSV